MKQDARTVVDEAAEAPSVRLDGLDLGIESLGNRVGDRMHEVSQQVGQMFFECRGHRLDLGQTGAHDTAMPVLEEFGAVCGVGLRPALEELFFLAPGFGGLQIDLQQFRKAGLLALRH